MKGELTPEAQEMVDRLKSGAFEVALMALAALAFLAWILARMAQTRSRHRREEEHQDITALSTSS